jgi:hypothetical protein
MVKIKFLSFAATISLGCNLVPFASPAFAATNAALVKIDIATTGSWTGAYGSDGYLLSQYSVTIGP